MRATASALGAAVLPLALAFASTFVIALPFSSPAIAQVIPLASWTGSGSGEQFGFAVAIGGDANGDGRADLAVGACTNDQGGTDAGKVSIYFGRVVPSGSPDLELIGPPGSFFGAAVAWAGDVNGDGYDDLVVGAYRDGQAGDLAGKAFVFFGGSPMDSVPDLVLVGPGAGAYFGRAVCGAGDLNGDGIDDFAIGAPRTTNGTVYVYFGGRPPDATPDLVIQGLAAGDWFGSSIAGCGNVDNRPGDDLLVGAPRASVAHLWEGAAYLFSGGSGLDATPDWICAGAGAGDQFGTSVAAGGDVNGDGAPDILVGAPYHNNGTTLDAGAGYLFYGGSRLDTTADFTILGTRSAEYLGTSIAGCGDVTGSGYGHFVVGAPGDDSAGTDAGKVILSPGGDPPEQGALISINGESAGDQFGYAVAGDAGTSNLSFTGSSRPDFGVGAWGHGNGKAYVYGLAGDGSDAPTVPGGSGSGGGEIAVRAMPNPAHDGVDFRYEAPRPGGTDRPEDAPAISIFDASGRLVRVLRDRSHDRIHWDARDREGRPVAPGTYFYSVTRSGEAVKTGAGARGAITIF